MLLFADFPALLPVFDPRLSHARLVVVEVVLRNVFWKYFGFP
jgi:hypothetical protein